MGFNVSNEANRLVAIMIFLSILFFVPKVSSCESIEGKSDIEASDITTQSEAFSNKPSKKHTTTHHHHKVNKDEHCSTKQSERQEGHDCCECCDICNCKDCEECVLLFNATSLLESLMYDLILTDKQSSFMFYEQFVSVNSPPNFPPPNRYDCLIN